MKAFFLFAMLIFLYAASFGQNIFPSSGWVGLGTTSPISLLDIVGRLPTMYLRNTDSSSSVLKIIPFWNGDVYVETGSSIASDSRADLKFTSMNDGTDFMTIQGATGNIGIGTSSPVNALDVYRNVGGSGNAVRVDCKDQNSFLHSIVMGANTSRSAIGTYSNDNLSFFTNNGPDILTMTTLGNVLIGKTSQANSSYKLDVNGKIRANQVTVNSSGADYVFDSSYQVPSLDSVSAYVKQNHHLPGIPSAKTVEMNGINLGNAYTELLAKVEEMTEYLIRQDKREADMTVQIRQLKAQVIDLKRQINKLRR